MRFDGKETKRKITKYSLDELSAVPKGAQAPAKMAIIKISANDKRDALQAALQEMYKGSDVYVYVEDYDDEYVICSKNGPGKPYETYAVGYSMQDGKATLVGEPVPVKRKSFYADEDGKAFFKTVAEDILEQYELDESMVTAIAKCEEHDAITTVAHVTDQVTALALQFGKAATKSVDGEAHESSDFAYVPDKEKPSTWKLPIFDARHVSAAVAALGKGFRGKKVSIPEADHGKVLQNVRAAYREHFPDKDLPDVLEKELMGDKTVEQLQKELETVNAQLTEQSVLAKMTDAEKAYMEKMPEKDRKAFMEMDEKDRKAKMKTMKAEDDEFTDVSGQVIVKSEVGEGAFAMLKATNDRLAKMEEQNANNEALELVKALCPDLPGEDLEKASAIRKAKGALSEEEFGTLEKALKAGNEAMRVRKQSKVNTDTDNPDVGTAKAAYDDGIAKIMSEKKLSKTAAMQTSEGRKLAKEFRDAQEAE